MDRNYDVLTFISNNFSLRKPGVAIFAETIKIFMMSLW